jgi:hypothetical protein
MHMICHVTSILHDNLSECHILPSNIVLIMILIMLLFFGIVLILAQIHSNTSSQILCRYIRSTSWYHIEWKKTQFDFTVFKRYKKKREMKEEKK